MSYTVLQILNAALVRCAYPTMIGNLYEGSRASRIGLNIYAQTRDALLSEFDWSFARQTVSLGAPLKTAPAPGYGGTGWDPATNPPMPWLYEYAYPDNCINIRAVMPTPVFLPVQMPRVNICAQGFDTLLGQKVVLTNLANAIAIITAQTTNPEEWQDNDFVEALIDRLVVAYAKALGVDAARLQLDERDAAASEAQASTLP